MAAGVGGGIRADNKLRFMVHVNFQVDCECFFLMVQLWLSLLFGFVVRFFVCWCFCCGCCCFGFCFCCVSLFVFCVAVAADAAACVVWTVVS